MKPGRGQKHLGEQILSYLVLGSLFFLSVESNLPTVQSAPGPLKTAPALLIPRHGVVDGGGGRASSSDIVDVNSARQEPAPMGIADYGVGPNGAYQYSTNSSMGVVAISSLSTQNSTGNKEMTVQLNVNLQFSEGGKSYVYWVQDVAFIDTETNLIFFENNIWNFSSPQAHLRASALVGDGSVNAYANSSFYATDADSSLAGNGVDLVYPATIVLEVNATVNSSDQPVVKFAYDDGPALMTYDTVTFLTSGKITLPGFVVDGASYNPIGIFYDSELILGGPGGGESTALVSSDVGLQLEYWNGHNYQSVSNAYNHGSDTAEGISNTVSQEEYYLANGVLKNAVSVGSGTLGKLFDQSEVSIIDIRSPLTSGVLSVRNATSTGSAAQFAFVNGEVTVTIYHGTYDLQVYHGGSLYSQGQFTVSRGQLLQLRTPLSGLAITLSYSIVGGGTPTSPPTLSYSYDGTQRTIILTTAPTEYRVDPGSTWIVTAPSVQTSTTERWQTNQALNGTVSSSQTMSLVFYHQYSISVAYSIVGGGEGASGAPTFSYTAFGISSSYGLSHTSTQNFWADSGPYTVTNPLAGSTASERWFATAGTGSILGPGNVSLAYNLQYLLTIAGANLQSQWHDGGSVAVVNASGVYGRSAGTGQRITSYSIDNGGPIGVSPTKGTVSAQVLMNNPHSLVFTSLAQEQVTLDPTASRALNFITPPTIGGDDYWYDSGTSVSVVLNGVWGRTASGSGSRLTTFVVDGGSQVAVATTGTVNALSGAAISSPQSISATSLAQFSLNTSAGSLASVTPPSLEGDSGWYDSGTAVRAVYSYAWSVATGQSRLDAVAYSVDGGQMTTLPRSGNGTFAVSVSMDRSHQVAVSAVTQYMLLVSGGFSPILSPPSPTNDGFYDAGSSVTATTPYTLDPPVAGASRDTARQILIGYSVDGRSQNFSRQDSGDFTVPAIRLDSYHSLVFKSITQYLVPFTFTNASGSKSLTPSSLELSVEEAQVTQDASGFRVWLDNGTSFVVTSLKWEGVDVKPLQGSPYVVGPTLAPSIRARVFDVRLQIMDYLGIPISGAKAGITLANGSKISDTTASDGIIIVQSIPLGTFSASVNNLGVSTQILGDVPSTQGTVVSKLPMSYTTLGLIMITILAIAVGSVLGMRRRRGNRVIPAMV